MEQRKQLVRESVSKGLRVDTAVMIAGIKKSTYYYRYNGKAKGKKPSTYTLNSEGEKVKNDNVVEAIINLISPEYHDYGYHVVTHLLKNSGYIINPKKVYRLMKENNLLHPRIEKSKGIHKEYIENYVPPLERPFATIETDIKYVYIHGENRNAYLLTFLCTFCRYAPAWELDFSMRTDQIIKLLAGFLNNPIVRENIGYQNIDFKIRTDNGPQFISKKLAEVLERIGIKHEFIFPATPEQNGHIESFHSTVTRLVCNRNIFSRLDHARAIFSEFYYAYNYTRVMGSLLYNSPADFIEKWKSGVVGIKKDKRNKQIFFFREKPSHVNEIGSSPEDFSGLYKNNNFENALQTVQ